MPYQTPDDQAPSGQEVMAHMLGQVRHVIYCNCTVTLVHEVVPCEAIPQAVPEEFMEEGGRCQECHALVRAGHVDTFLVAGPTIALKMQSRTMEAIHADGN